MKSDKEFVGTLRGFDEFVNIILEDVSEYTPAADGSKAVHKIDQMLLNGNNVAALVPGSSPEDAAERYVGPKPVPATGSR